MIESDKFKPHSQFIRERQQYGFQSYSAWHALELWGHKSLILKGCSVTDWQRYKNSTVKWGFNKRNILGDSVVICREPSLSICMDPWPMKWEWEKTDGKLSIISILSNLTGAGWGLRLLRLWMEETSKATVLYSLLSQCWQRLGTERPPQKSQSHGGQKVGVCWARPHWQDLTVLMVKGNNATLSQFYGALGEIHVKQQGPQGWHLEFKLSM